MYSLAKFQDGEANKSDEILEENPISKQRKDIILAGRTESFTKKTLEESKEKEAVSVILGKQSTYIELGMVEGVLLPFLQANMVGAILFLRLPYIIGQAGVILASIIFFLCISSTSLTLLSLSALASNGKINKSGGIYQLISRNLGAELGGSVGLLYYLGKALVASMYCLGAAEAFLTGLGLMDSFPWDKQIIALAICFILCVVVHHTNAKHIDILAKFFLGVAAITVLSFTIGGIAFANKTYVGELHKDDRVINDNVHGVFVKDNELAYKATFENMLALYYPSVIGIMSGSNTPGSVAKPGINIPRGTTIGIIITSCISLLIVYLFGFTLSNQRLLHDKLLLASIAWPVDALVYTGICLCCVGGSLQSLVATPRLLSAIASDHVIPFLDIFTSKNESDRVRGNLAAVWLTWLLASIPCLAGYLDNLTTVIALLFLLMYTAVNVACFLLSVIKSPGFRPHFKYFSWHTALLGSVWCLALMFVINWWITLVFMGVLVVLVAYISQSAARKDWGDALSGLMFQTARNTLLYLTNRQSSNQHAKNWVPQILVITRMKEQGGTAKITMAPEQEKLIRLAGQMKKGKGFTMIVAVIQGDPTCFDVNVVDRAQDQLTDFLRNENIESFPRVGVVRDLNTSFDTILQMAGIGPLQPNTVLCEWPDRWESYSYQSLEGHVDRYKAVISTRKALVVVKGTSFLPDNNEKLKGHIDVWWVVHDGDLLLLLPYLLSLHKVWRGCVLRLFVVMTKAEDNPIAVQRSAEEFLEKIRIQALVVVIDMSSSETTGYVYERTLDQRARQQLLKSMRGADPSAPNSNHNTLSSVGGGSSGGGSGANSLLDAFDKRERSQSLGEAPRAHILDIFGSGVASTSASYDPANNTTTITATDSLANAGTTSASRENKDSNNQTLNQKLLTDVIVSEKSNVLLEPDIEHHTSTKAVIANSQSLPLDEVKDNMMITTRNPSTAKIVLSAHKFEAKSLEREGLAVPTTLSARNKEVAMEEIAKIKSIPFRVDHTRIQVAMKFNALLKEHSKDSKLIVTNLPLIRKLDPKEFIAYVSVLTEDIAPILLVRGSGKEVVTTSG